jgi:hypothetical protein
MPKNEINKFNLIKKKSFLKKQNLTKTKKKTQNSPCYFKKKNKPYRKRVKKCVCVA